VTPFTGLTIVVASLIGLGAVVLQSVPDAIAGLSLMLAAGIFDANRRGQR